MTREGTVLYGSVIRSAWTRGLPRPLSAPPRKRTEEDSSYRFASRLRFCHNLKNRPAGRRPSKRNERKVETQAMPMRYG